MTSINFDFDLNLLTDDKAKQFLQDIVESPPQNTIPYYVGPIDTSGTLLASLFPSGALSILGDLPGINTLYMHIGERGSGTAFHCEDAHLRSYNLNIYGWKLWIMIDPDDTAKFERMLATKFPLHKCDQSVRHLNVMVSPKRLRQEGIKFDIIRAGPGDLVITRPRQYHAVLNQTPSLAIATNYTLLGEQAIPPGWVVCPRDGLYSLSHDNLEKLPNEPPTKKRKANATASPYRKRQNTRQSRGISNFAVNNNAKPRYYQDKEEQNKQQDEEDSEGYAQRHDQQQEQQDNQEEEEEDEEDDEESEVHDHQHNHQHDQQQEQDDNQEDDEEEDEEEDEKEDEDDHQHNQEHDKQQHQAQYNHQKHGNNENGNQNSDNDTDADTDIESGRRLASLTIDHNAILRFMSIVYAWDSADDTLKSSFASRKPTDELSTARHYDHLRRKAQNLSILYTVLGMSASFRLSKVIKEDQHRHRISASCMSAVLAGRGIEDTLAARKAFTAEISEARKIMRMVEGYDGLLCFLP
ncbi:hypothetical protein QBC45DRAFT_428579, partial [Copromyces sp. CBS 386.78]